MYNDDMLQNIEYLREKADVSYEEAANLLERNDGNVMRVLVELEHQGRVYAQAGAGETYKSNAQCKREAKEKATSFIDRAFATRLIVEKKQENGAKETVANLNVPFAAAVAICAPYITVATAAIGFATGHTVRIKKEQPAAPKAE